jgi:hypothetical protein
MELKDHYVIYSKYHISSNHQFPKSLLLITPSTNAKITVSQQIAFIYNKGFAIDHNYPLRITKLLLKRLGMAYSFLRKISFGEKSTAFNF